MPTAAATLAWLSKVDHDNLFLLLDLGHCLISDEDPTQVIAQAGRRLGYVHLDDNDGAGENDDRCQDNDQQRRNDQNNIDARLRGFPDRLVFTAAHARTFSFGRGLSALGLIGRGLVDPQPLCEIVESRLSFAWTIAQYVNTQRPGSSSRPGLFVACRRFRWGVG